MFNKNRTNSNIKKKSYSSFFLSLLFLLTFILILFNKTDYFLINKVKDLGIDLTSPITRFISSPVTILMNIGVRINNIKNLEKDNLKLKEEIIRLKKWQTLAIKNSRENRVFKRLLNSTSHEVEIIKTASVINKSPGIYNKLITINAGLNFNVEKDLAVINEKGLVGKTIFSSKSGDNIPSIANFNSSIAL